MNSLTQALAAGNQPTAYFRELEKLADTTIGVKLFTLMEIDHDRQVSRRCYTNHPDSYPVSGEKPVPQNAWTALVQDQRKSFVANSIEEIAAVLPDHEIIKSLGCESCLNLPIVINDNVIGTLNCLNVAGHYTPDRVEAAQSLQTAGALAFLLHAHISRLS